MPCLEASCIRTAQRRLGTHCVSRSELMSQDVLRAETWGRRLETLPRLRHRVSYQDTGCYALWFRPPTTSPTGSVSVPRVGTYLRREDFLLWFIRQTSLVGVSLGRILKIWRRRCSRQQRHTNTMCFGAAALRSLAYCLIARVFVPTEAHLLDPSIAHHVLRARLLCGRRKRIRLCTAWRRASTAGCMYALARQPASKNRTHIVTA